MENFADVTAHTLKFIDQFANGFPSDKSEINAKLAEGRALLAQYKGSGIIPAPESVARLIEVTSDLHRLAAGQPTIADQQRLAKDARNKKALERVASERVDDSTKPSAKTSDDKPKPRIDVRDRASVEAETARLRTARLAAQKAEVRKKVLDDSERRRTKPAADSTSEGTANAAIYAKLATTVSELERLRNEIESETAQLEAENRTFATAANEARRLRKLLRHPTAVGAIRSQYETRLEECERQMREILASRISDKLNQYENLRALERSLTASRSKTKINKEDKTVNSETFVKQNGSLRDLLSNPQAQRKAIGNRINELEVKLAAARNDLLTTNHQYAGYHSAANRARKELSTCRNLIRIEGLQSRLSHAESRMFELIVGHTPSLRETVSELIELKSVFDSVNK